MDDFKVIYPTEPDKNKLKIDIINDLRDDYNKRMTYAKLSSKLELVDYDVLSYYVDQPQEKKNDILKIMWYLIKNTPKFVKIVKKFIELLEVLKMNTDQKTTFIATVKVILGIVALVLSLFGQTLPPNIQEALIAIAGSGYLVFSWIQGFFTNKKEHKDDQKNTTNQ